MRWKLDTKDKEAKKIKNAIDAKLNVNSGMQWGYSTQPPNAFYFSGTLQNNSSSGERRFRNRLEFPDDSQGKKPYPTPLHEPGNLNSASAEYGNARNHAGNTFTPTRIRVPLKVMMQIMG